MTADDEKQDVAENCWKRGAWIKLSKVLLHDVMFRG